MKLLVGGVVWRRMLNGKSNLSRAGGPEFRVYAAWQQILEDHGVELAADELALVLADRGVSGAAYTAPKLKPFLDDFPRRRAALAGEWMDSNA